MSGEEELECRFVENIHHRVVGRVENEDAVHSIYISHCTHCHIR